MTRVRALASPYQSARKRLLGTARARLGIMIAVSAGVTLLIALRLFQLAVVEGSGPGGSLAFKAAVPPRAAIVDRNGVLLADTRLAPIFGVRPAGLFRTPDELTPLIAAAMPGVPAAHIRAQLTANAKFRYIKRRISNAEYQRLYALGEAEAFVFTPEPQRVYPNGPLAAHLIGFADSEGRGRAGVEARFDERLSARGATGAPLNLSLDSRVQHALEHELQSGMTEQNALGAAGVVMDVRTGEIIAIASLPDFDPNRPPPGNDLNQFNRATQGVYELGSVFKIFSIADALDTGLVTLSTVWDATAPLQVGRYRIHDDHPKRRPLTTVETFIYSSNIATSRMADLMGTELVQQGLGKLGLLNPLTMELSALAPPLLPQRWGRIETMTVAYGHGMAVTPVHVAQAMAAVVNGGYRVPATILRTSVDGRTPARRVLSAETSLAMRKLLRLAVMQGTGKRAEVPGLLTGGKTGTAEKPGIGGYRKKAVIATFAGAFPMDDPRYVVVLSIDEPRGTAALPGMIGAGLVSAPIFQKLVQRIGPQLGVHFDPGRTIDVSDMIPLVREMNPAPLPDRKQENRKLEKMSDGGDSPVLPPAPTPAVAPPPDPVSARVNALLRGSQ